MAPSAIADHPVKDEVVAPKLTELIPVPAPGARGTVCTLEAQREIKPALKFSQAVLLDENHFKTGSRSVKLAVSILTHVAVIAAPILIGLFFTDTINIKQYASMMLGPPPPPPPPATNPIVRAAAVRPRFITGGKLFAPTVILKQVADIKEEPVEPDSFVGVAGGGAGRCAGRADGRGACWGARRSPKYVGETSGTNRKASTHPSGRARKTAKGYCATAS